MPLTDEELQTLTELAEKAGDELPPLPGYVPQKDIVGRLAAKDKQRETALAEANARLAEIQRAFEDKDARLREYEDKGKSADEKALEELRREREAREATTKALHAERDRATQLEQRAARRELEYRLTHLLEGAHRPRHALLAALDEHPGLSAEADGNGGYKLSYTKDGLPVDRPEDEIKAWWVKQTHLQGKRGGELPLTNGGRVKPPEKDPTEGMTEAQAFAYLAQRYG